MNDRQAIDNNRTDKQNKNLKIKNQKFNCISNMYKNPVYHQSYVYYH